MFLGDIDIVEVVELCYTVLSLLVEFVPVDEERFSGRTSDVVLVDSSMALPLGVQLASNGVHTTRKSRGLSEVNLQAMIKDVTLGDRSFQIRCRLVRSQVERLLPQLAIFNLICHVYLLAVCCCKSDFF